MRSQGHQGHVGHNEESGFYASGNGEALGGVLFEQLPRPNLCFEIFLAALQKMD